MTTNFEKNIENLGLTLPEASAPVANYVGYVVSGKNVFISGQIPIANGDLPYKGKLGDTVSLEDGIQAAQLCGLNIIAQLKAACGGDLSKVVRCVKLGGFVACTPDFSDHPKVINGTSDLMVDVFGEKGKHARAAVGVPSLPLDVAVEVDAIFEIA
ncbi:MAG: RidA family protein [Alphaproteobacteria bacterium]